MKAGLRIKYVFIGGVLKQHSVQNKISHQINALNLHGIETRGWFFNTLSGEEASGKYNENIEKIPLPEYTQQHRYYQQYHVDQFHYEHIAAYLKAHADEFDFIFLRHTGNGPGYDSILSAVPEKTILYIPSNRVRETFCERRYADDASLISSLFGWYGYYRFWKNEQRIFKQHLQHLAAIVTFTPEFGRIIQRSSSGTLKLIYNRDGVDTASVPQRRYRPAEGEEVKIIFLKGSNQNQKWAGLDRLIKSIEAYPELPFKLYITGNADRHPEKYGRPFVTLTGKLPFAELEQLIDEVDLGVSNLENYLIHFNETTNLKSRDYYSRGLPFIQSNTMPDIEATVAEQFYLHIPNDDSIIDMERVYAFAMKMRQQAQHPAEMHRFATQHLDWKVTVGELAEEIKALSNS